MPSIREWVRKVVSDELGNYDSYRVLGVIGRGGFSEVRLVEKRGHRYAMKVPLNTSRYNGTAGDDTLPMQNVDSAEQFRREAEIWSQVTEEARDSAVGLLDCNTDPFPWMVMDLADEDLAHAMRNGEVDVRTLIDLLRSLQRIHDMGIVHRDIKPENILRINGVWKFSDFGLSKSITSVSSGSLKGTPVYMAPEQCMPRKLGSVDARTDIWQMGILAFRVLTGKDPYPGADQDSILSVICMEGPDVAQVPERYRAVMERALAQRKDDRFQSAMEFADALEAAAEGRSQQSSVKTDRGILSYAISLYAGDGHRYDPKAAYMALESGTGICRALAAFMKYSGNGTSEDETLARTMFEGSFSSPSEIIDGSPESEWIYGLYLSEGFIVGQSYNEAFIHFKKAADLSFAPAMQMLGQFYGDGTGVEQSDSESLRWLLKAAEKGNVYAQTSVGYRYNNGTGVEPSYKEAAKWYARAAEQGYDVAQNNLGLFYELGNGVQQSYEEAAKWYARAAEQGYYESQNNLGYFYKKGLGVPQSYEEAAKWYARAAEQGYDKAQYNLALCYEKGLGVVQSYEEAVSWYIKSAEQGNAKAQNNLGACYFDGRGVPKSIGEAKKWFKMAADQGYDTAIKNYRLVSALTNSP